MDFKHNFFNMPIINKEKLSSEKMVEIGGYRSPQRQIQDLLDAGKRLNVARERAFYDIPPGSDLKDSDIPLDPLRQKGADLTDFDRATKNASAVIAKARDYVKSESDKQLEARKKASQSENKATEKVA